MQLHEEAAVDIARLAIAVVVFVGRTTTLIRSGLRCINAIDIERAGELATSRLVDG